MLVKDTVELKTALAYSFLDLDSTTFQCDKHLLDSIKITGELTGFNITTANEQALNCCSTKVNLTITFLTKENSVFLQIILSIDQLPVGPNHCLMKKKLDAWPYQRDLDFPSIAAEILLLIGVNSPEAFRLAEEQ